MDRILIVGLDTIAGANLAATIRDRYEVRGVCSETQISVTGCTTESSSVSESLSIIQRTRPDRIIFCGPDGQSGWDSPRRIPNESEMVRLAQSWSEAAARTDTRLTLLSSASVFTGPWMFHDEDSDRFSGHPAARAILAVEREFQNRVRNVLVVRTHPFGWSPLGEETGFAATLLNRLRVGEASSIDCVRHAGPILATDLAGILEKTFAAELTGVIHIGGAERINPFRFVTILSEQFGYPCSVTGSIIPVGDRRADFGAGETSLNCRRIRSELGIGLPMLEEGVQRFHAQFLGDFRDQFQIIGRPTRNLVA